jgi:hypothetical protein
MKTTSKTRTASIRRELDVLLQAAEGIGACNIVRAIAVEAVAADEGDYTDTAGNPGYAWNPKGYLDKSDPVGFRIYSAAQSLGRVMAGGNCDARTYAAFMEGIYKVTVNQDYDVTRRIEQLWDALPSVEITDEVVVQRPSRLKRILRWLGKWFLWNPYHHKEV